MSKTRSYTIYRILDRKTNQAQGVYSRAYHDEYDFNSKSEALSANCHGIHRDKQQYKVSKFRVTYELIEDDV